MKKQLLILGWLVIFAVFFILIFKFQKSAEPNEFVTTPSPSIKNDRGYQEPTIITLVSTSTQADLNGDGKIDTITLVITSPSDYQNYTTKFTVNDTVVEKEYSGSLEENFQNFAIVDIDARDGYKEIAFSDDGPSNDYSTIFYSYDGKNIRTIGTLPYFWEGMKFNGSGIITTVKRGDILDTWFHDEDYQLSSGAFKNTPRSFYAREGYPKNTVLKSLPLQISPTNSEIAFVLQVGEKVTITGCDDIKWCQVKNSKGQVGWFALRNHDIVIGPEARGGEFFDGLSYAD